MNGIQHPRPVLVVDIDAHDVQQAARVVRGCDIYSEVIGGNRPVSEFLTAQPQAVLLVGRGTDKTVGLVAELLAHDIPVAAVGSEAGALDLPHAVVRIANNEAIADYLVHELGLSREWTTDLVIADQIAKVKAQVGDARLICGLSGGVDSAVAAALVQRAVGDQLTCVLVDHGLMRADEVEQVERDFVAATGAKLLVIDARERFISALAGVSDPEQKRKIIGHEFIEIFESAAREVVAAGGPDEAPVRFLVQGTVYPDVVESGVGDGAKNIKSHHNVGGLPDDLQFELVEPLRELFKNEVRQVGLALGVPESIVWRQPFPGPGLGIRIVGEVTAERLETLRAADAILREELTRAGLDREIWQCPVVLLADVRSVGVMEGERTYGHPIVLRPVVSEDAMTAEWFRLPYDLLARVSDRITAEVPEVNRVVLDVTRKPPGTIEWE
ncbi:MAG TPA: glutamine-hydrolyzing GMP synthase [Actinomycetales bacterium]|nr:glutamine-hydrolyzing GMP synthase [Actinomycetales bacterium]